MGRPNSSAATTTFVRRRTFSGVLYLSINSLNNGTSFSRGSGLLPVVYSTRTKFFLRQVITVPGKVPHSKSPTLDFAALHSEIDASSGYTARNHVELGADGIF